MRAGQKHTDGTGLVFADFSLKSGGLNTVLNRLSAVVNTVRESDKFTVEVCSALVGVVGNVRFIWLLSIKIQPGKSDWQMSIQRTLINFQKKICIVWDVILIWCPKRCVVIVI